jgi:hypothetical protein
MCELNARKEKKGEKIPSFANSMGQSCWQSWLANSFGPGCWQSWASPEARAGFANSFFANSLVQRICQQLRLMLLAKQAVGKAVVPFANRTLPTAVASLLAKVTTS